MKFLLLVIAIGYLFGLIYFAFKFARIDNVFRVRKSFWDDDLYRKLPTFREMVSNPKHYGKWTKAHWKKYLSGQCTGCQYEIVHEGKKVCRTMTRTHGQQCDAYRERKE